MPLGGTDETFEDDADDFVVELRKIEFVDLVDQAAPIRGCVIAVERNPGSEARVIFTEHRFVVAGDLFGLGKEAFEVQAQVIAAIQVPGDIEFR